jgi:hypothetical protein
MKRKSIIFLITTVIMFTMMGSLSAFAADLPTGDSFDTPPQNLTVELKEWEDGRPYFALKWTNPQSVWALERYGVEHGEWGAEYQIDMKVGDGQWRYDMGESISGNALNFDEEEFDEPGNYVTDDVTCDPTDLGVDGSVDIKANVYHIRVRYAYLAYSDDDGDHWIYSPFSNTASIGTGAFYKEASDWAKSELQKANDLGLFPAILKGADMTKPITREEFCELAVLLYEKVTGQKSEPVSPNPFTDTANPQILKAFNLGITMGTSQTTFSPKVLINREQCAAMLFRAIKAIHPQGDYSIAGVKDFPDQKHISSWAVEATKYMNKIGVIAGDAQGNFMPKATTPAQEVAGYGMATREQAIALSVRTHDKAPEIKASSADNSNPDANSSGKAADSGGRLPADIIAGLPGWLPDWFLDIPIAADAEFGALGGIYPTSDDMIVISYTSEQTLEALYYLYVDFMKGLEDFFTYKQDDGKAYYVRGVKDGWEIDISVALSGGNLVGINVKPHEEH